MINIEIPKPDITLIKQKHNGKGPNDKQRRDPLCIAYGWCRHNQFLPVATA
ncbi:hypothetical protein J22TS1_43140 [Siminovitchia terrae]|uniref:hypothetical protein n=1 Tax=Siminovitchia terrae TaxID=1914933 RepID=UPI001B00FED8|nr:hypothetical protein [Siminovitchia terrae]GIN93263.1 hypothetical protein J22TS1_43140 [Siminovitchia terrae]